MKETMFIVFLIGMIVGLLVHPTIMLCIRHLDKQMDIEMKLHPELRHR